MKYKIQKAKPGSRAGRKYRARLRKRFKKPIPRHVVPSFFTLMNLFCGFIAIIQILEGKPVFGAWLIVFAGIFDMFDGVMARLANANSEFGIELDSLSDMVSFGAAPAVLLYTFGLHEMMVLGLIVCALLPLCGAVRLARFNVDAKLEDDPDYFKGLPIPAQAIMVVAFYLTFHGSMELFEGFQYGVNSLLIPMIILLSFLMVSTVPFDKIPRFTRGYIRHHRGRVILFFIYFLLIISLQEYGLMIVFSVFILKGLVTSLVHYWRDLISDDVEGDDEDGAIGLINDK